MQGLVNHDRKHRKLTAWAVSSSFKDTSGHSHPKAWSLSFKARIFIDSSLSAFKNFCHLNRSLSAESTALLRRLPDFRQRDDAAFVRGAGGSQADPHRQGRFRGPNGDGPFAATHEIGENREDPFVRAAVPPP